MGVDSLLNNSTGANNSAVGNSSLTSNTTGGSNSAMGVESLYFNTTGANNSAVGAFSLNSNTEGSDNLSMGAFSLFTNSTGAQNSAVGRDSLRNNTTGADNSAMGNGSLKNNTTGSNNVAIGFNAGSSGVVNTTQSNRIYLGNVDHTSIHCATQNITALSDGRDKTDIVDSPYGLEFIKKIRPVQFKWSSRGKTLAKDGTSELGFVAQELLAACGENNDVIGLANDEDPDRLQAAYGKLLPILTKAIQDQSAIIDAQQAQIDSLSDRLTTLEEGL
jgi:hypothetical protein